jgi:hypothetical protein
LARDIYRDFYRQLDKSSKETLARGAKIAGTAFAGCALMLAALDAAGIHSVQDIRGYAQAVGLHADLLGGAMRAGNDSIAVAETSEVVIVAIRDVPGRSVATAAAKTETSTAPEQKVAITPRAAINPLAGLAAAKSQDAITVAMAVPAQKADDQLTPLFAGLAPLPQAKVVVLGTALNDFASAMPPLKLASIRLDEPIENQSPFPPPPAFSRPEEPAPVKSVALFAPGEVPLPRPAPGAPLPSPAELLGLKNNPAAYAKAERCLANAIYFEARSEQVRGQMAVAQVVVNRAFSGFYPSDICSVVYQNAHRRLACQFTFACDGKRKTINERGAWARAKRIAKQTLDGLIYLPEVAKSTHYHAAYVHPYWAREMKRLARYGLHSVYRPRAWGNGAGEPVWGHAAMAQARKSDLK